MSFKTRFRIKFRPVAAVAVAEPFELWRDKETGSVTAVIRDGSVSRQKADSMARGMFVSPVRLVGREVVGSVETRRYMAQNYLTLAKD